jgi:hypothetical protein
VIEIELPTARPADRHHPAASGAGCRQVAARPAPDANLHRPQPLRRRADGDRLRARHAQPEEAGAYLRKLRSILRYLGTCDGNMEEGSMRCRRQRLGAQARRAVRHALRGQERQLDPLRHAGDRGRGAKRQVEVMGGRRHGRAGNPAVRRARRDAVDALEGGRARLPLLPRSRPAAAGAGRGLGRRAEGRAARTAGRQEGALHPITAVGLRRRRAGRRAGDGGFLRNGRQGPRRQSSPPTG